MKDTSKLKKTVRFYQYKTLYILFSDTKKSSKVGNWLQKKLLQDKKSAYRAVVEGRITHVGYEGWIRRKALEQSLTIYSRKRDKTTLEIFVEGKADNLEGFIKTLWKGSKRSKVKNVQIQWLNHIEKTSHNEEEIQDVEGIKRFEEFENIIKENLRILQPIIQQPNHYEDIEEITNTSEIYRSATELGLKTIKEGSLNYINFHNHTLGFQQSQSSRVSTLIRSITDHKQLTKEVLQSYNLPVPKGAVFENLEEAKQYLHQYKNGLVVKPLEGSYGQGITVGIYDEKGLEKAWNYAKKYHHKIILEELLLGIDIRVLVIHGKAQVAMSRLPANVIGDGIKNVQELIQEKNKFRLKNPRLSTALIIIDQEMKRFLRTRGYDLQYIPSKGEIFFLNMKGNIGSGADSINITPYVNKDLLALAEEAAKVMGVTDFWGIDLLVERIDKTRNEQKCGIIEMNARANIFNVRFPIYGEPFDAAKALIERELLKDIKKEEEKNSTEKLKEINAITNIQEDLWKIHKATKIGFTTLKQSSIFADKACGERILEKKILRENDIPVFRDKKFKLVKEAKRFYKKNPSFNRLISVYSYKSQVYKINSIKDIGNIWKEEINKGAKFFLLEEDFQGEKVEFLIQGSSILEIIKKPENIKIHHEYEKLAIKAMQTIPGLNLARVYMTSKDFTQWKSNIEYKVEHISPNIGLHGENNDIRVKEILTNLFVENEILWKQRE